MKEDEKYAKFFKLQKMGMPAEQIKLKMSAEGLNPDLLDTPDALLPGLNDAGVKTATTTVKEEWRTKIPAVTHIDNSARHQSVTEDSNPRFYKLIKNFYDKTGVPVLLNTSFNGPHEPIVESPSDAIKTMFSCKLDFLVIGNILIKR